MTLPILLWNANVFAQEAEATKTEWTQILAKGTNAIWCVRETGDLFASNGKQVLFTRDAGSSWTEAAPPREKGRHFNSIAISADWRGARLAAFPIDSPVGWTTLDGGKTWTTFAKPTPPQVKKHDGWTLGAVDWSEEQPTRYFGKEHHTNSFWLSTDGGATWSKLDSLSGYFGVGVAPDGSLLAGCMPAAEGKGVYKPNESGIFRSVDKGATWTRVLECGMRQKMCPKTYDSRIYWPTLDGLAVSSDNGSSWRLIEGSPKDALYGPFFGETDQAMLVVSLEGVFRTSDGGKTWSLILKPEELPKAVADGNFKELMPNFAWDWKRNILYATSQGVPLFKREFQASRP
jgi:photosystem II stability/assembly factor-like uncharacterized protein